MIHFVADIHLPLQVDNPLTTHFLDYLNTQAKEAETLYILGDLFDVWLGDDIGLVQFETVISALLKYTQSGRQLIVLKGNRDFLLGEQFAQASQCQLIHSDTFCLTINGSNLCLLHGDTLCTDDHDYLEMRQQFHTPQWQQWFLSLLIQERMTLAQKIQQESQHQKNTKQRDIMDVSQEGLEMLLTQHPKTQVIIHGHTHRPQHHQQIIHHHPIERWVLSDWRPTPKAILGWTQDTGATLLPWK